MNVQKLGEVVIRGLLDWWSGDVGIADSVRIGQGESRGGECQ